MNANDLARQALLDAAATHGRLAEADLAPVAAARAPEVHRRLLHVIGDLVERAFT